MTFYNFCKLHKTHGLSPAMAAGVTDRLWEIADIETLVEASYRKAGKRGSYKKKGQT